MGQTPGFFHPKKTGSGKCFVLTFVQATRKIDRVMGVMLLGASS
jgi:hypothetical protein